MWNRREPAAWERTVRLVNAKPDEPDETESQPAAADGEIYVERQRIKLRRTRYVVYDVY